MSRLYDEFESEEDELEGEEDEFEEDEFEDDEFEDDEEEEDEEIEPIFTDPFEAITAYLNDSGLHPKRLPDAQGFAISFNGENGNLAGDVEIKSFGHLLICQMYYPDLASQSQKAIVAEFITRVNPKIYSGSLNMDWDAGRVYHRNSFKFKHIDLNYALIDNLLWPSFVAMDEFRLGLAAIIVDGKSADEAVQVMRGRWAFDV